MIILFPEHITKTAAASMMELGQHHALYITALPGDIVFLCEVGCQDEASEPIWASWRQPSAYACQAHLDCFTCVCNPVVHYSSLCVKHLAESKKSPATPLCRGKGNKERAKSTREGQLLALLGLYVHHWLVVHGMFNTSWQHFLSINTTLP